MNMNDMKKYGYTGCVLCVCAFGFAGLATSLQGSENYDFNTDNYMCTTGITETISSTTTVEHTTTTVTMTTDTTTTDVQTTMSDVCTYTTPDISTHTTDAPETHHVETDVPNSSTTTVTTVVPDSDEYKCVDLSDSEVYMLASLVTLEAGGEGYECQKAVASTVINRMYITGRSLYDVIYEPGQYSVSGTVSCTTPFDGVLEAVNEVVYNGTTLPVYVTYFRAGYYHSWGDQIPYCNFDNTYFSYSQSIRNKYE